MALFLAKYSLPDTSLEHQQHQQQDQQTVELNNEPQFSAIQAQPTDHYHDIEMSNLKIIQNLTTKLKVLEYKMSVLEPQYPINGRKNPQISERQNQIKEATRKLLLLSTSHGVPNLMRSDRLFVKIIWAISILVAIGVCAGFIIQNTTSYLEFDVFTKTKIYYKQEVNLPALTICLAINHKIPLEQVILYCKYLEINTCRVQDFKPVEVFDAKRFRLRRCYKFNGGSEIIKTNNVGYASGINIGLVLPKDDFIIYYIGDNHITPTFREISGLAQAGALTNLVIRKLVNQRLEMPYNDCYKNLNSPKNFDSDLFRQTLTVAPAYRQINCYDLCMINKIEAKCRCSGTNCSSIEGGNCTVREYGSFRIDQCESSCPLECDAVSYVTEKYSIYFSLNPVSLSDQDKLSEFFKEKLNSTNTSVKEMESRFLDLFLFYERLDETVISENAKMSLTEFISDNGGIAGLFLGISLLSFVEILELICEFYFIILG